MAQTSPQTPAKPTRDRLGRTALHFAAMAGNAPEVERLLGLGSEVSSQDSNGWSPLHFAAQAESAEVVESLLRAGAKIDLVDEHGNTALFRAVFRYTTSNGVIRMLLAAGADPNLRNKHGVSPAELAQTIANTDVAKHLSAAQQE